MNLEWLSILMTRELSAFSRELDLFDDESLIWSTVPGIANSAGNLALHVCGNLQHFIGATLGGTGYVRDREREFSARGIARAELQANLATTSDVVRVVLPKLSGMDFNAGFPELPGDLRVPSGLFLMHLSSHLAFHLGQAGYLRRVLTGENPQSSGAMAIRALAIEPSSTV
ncbi:MAG TPA: DinB superfamily protein [Thermoanaerobaculia bacterium]|jgi:hypothetical protein|nr:DinB superfamily protein [Thermoanaerobaculia bacterium]